MPLLGLLRSPTRAVRRFDKPARHDGRFVTDFAFDGHCVDTDAAMRQSNHYKTHKQKKRPDMSGRFHLPLVLSVGTQAG